MQVHFTFKAARVSSSYLTIMVYAGSILLIKFIGYAVIGLAALVRQAHHERLVVKVMKHTVEWVSA